MSEKKNKKTERMVWNPLRAVAGKAMRTGEQGNAPFNG